MTDKITVTFTELWQEIEREWILARLPQAALVEIASRYRRAEAPQRAQADAEIAEWLLCDYSGRRFAALALIREFGTPGVLPHLRELLRRLETTPGPEAKDEHASVEQVIRQLTEET